jgi:ATP-dependent Clp protease protease subunit
MTKPHPIVFAKVADKDAARQQWNDRFNNRKPLAERKPGKVEVKAAADGETEILLYDEIGHWGVTAKEFNTALAAISGPVKVRINSPGGDVFDGLAIHNALKAHPAEVVCQVDGWAASAASIIAMAGAKCVMADNAMLMCHCAWTLAIGNKADMQETVGVLEKIDGQLAGIYAKKSGKSSEECAAMMDGEGKADGTWFTAAEAKAWGLCDEIVAADPEEAAENAVPLRISAMRRRLAIVERDD